MLIFLKKLTILINNSIKHCSIYSFNYLYYIYLIIYIKKNFDESALLLVSFSTDLENLFFPEETEPCYRLFIILSKSALHLFPYQAFLQWASHTGG